MALTRYQGSENQGGVCQIRILKRCDFEKNQVIIERYRGKTGFIKISANDVLENVFPVNYFTHFVAEHKQPSSRSQHGHYNEQGFTFALSKDRPDILAQITQLQDEPLVIIFKNNNHDWKVIGTEEDFAMIEVAQETGTLPQDTNHYIFDIKCPSRYLSPFLEFEKREIIIPPENPCLHRKTSTFDKYNPTGAERRWQIPTNTNQWKPAGTFKMEYILPVTTTITIRSTESSLIYDQRTIQGTGEYIFTKNEERFMVIYGASAPTYEFWQLKIIEECI